MERQGESHGETERRRDQRDIEKQRESHGETERHRETERDMERHVEIREREISHVALGESPCDADLKTVNFCFN